MAPPFELKEYSFPQADLVLPSNKVLFNSVANLVELNQTLSIDVRRCKAEEERLQSVHEQLQHTLEATGDVYRREREADKKALSMLKKECEEWRKRADVHEQKEQLAVNTLEVFTGANIQDIHTLMMKHQQDMTDVNHTMTEHERMNKERLQQLAYAIQRKKEHNQSVQNELEKCRTHLGEVSLSLRQCENQKEMLNTKVNELQMNVAVIEENRRHLNNEVSRLESSLEQSNQTKDRLQNELCMSICRLEAVQRENQELKMKTPERPLVEYMDQCTQSLIHKLEALKEVKDHDQYNQDLLDAVKKTQEMIQTSHAIHEQTQEHKEERRTETAVQEDKVSIEALLNENALYRDKLQSFEQRLNTIFEEHNLVLSDLTHRYEATLHEIEVKKTDYDTLKKQTEEKEEVYKRSQQESADEIKELGLKVDSALNDFKEAVKTSEFYQTELRKSKESIKKYEEHVVTLNKQIEDYVNTVASLREQMKADVNHYASLNDVYNASKIKYAHLEQTYNECKKKHQRDIAEWEQFRTSLSNEQDTLKKDVTLLLEQVKTLDEHNLNSFVTAADEFIKNTLTSESQLMATYNAELSRRNKTEAELVEAHKNIASLKAQVEASNSYNVKDADETTEQVRVITRELQLIRSVNEALLDKNKNINGKLEEVRQELTQALKLVDASNAQNASLLIELEGAKSQIAALQNSETEYNKQYAQLLAKYNTVDPAAMNQMQTQIKEYAESLKKAEADKSAIIEQYKKLKETATERARAGFEFKRRYQEAEVKLATMNTLKQDIEKLTKEKEEAVEGRTAALEEASRSANALETRMNEYIALDEKYRNLSIRLRTRNNTLKEKLARITTLEAEMAELKKTVGDKAIEISRMNARCSMLTNKNNRLSKLLGIEVTEEHTETPVQVASTEKQAAPKETTSAPTEVKPVIKNTPSAAQNTPSAAQSTPSVVKSTPPAVKNTSSAVKSTPPAVKNIIPAAQSTPPAVKNITPVVEQSTAPIVEKVVQPVLEQTIEPMVEDTVAPVTEQVIAPVTEHVASPVTEQVASPMTEQVAQPVVEQDVTPMVEQVASPVAEQVASPVAEQVASPVAEQVASPVVEQVASPVVEQSTSSEQDVTPMVEEAVAPVIEENTLSAAEEAPETTMEESVPEQETATPMQETSDIKQTEEQETEQEVVEDVIPAEVVPVSTATLPEDTTNEPTPSEEDPAPTSDVPVKTESSSAEDNNQHTHSEEDTTPSHTEEGSTGVPAQIRITRSMKRKNLGDDKEESRKKPAQ